MFQGKNVVLGVTGSIAVYKAADIASKLVQKGLTVDVVMTRAAMQFVTPLTFRSITHRPVVTEMFELTSEFSVEHIALAERADLMVIAPATANTIAKIANGIADEMLSCTALATRAPVIIAPAMDVGMYQNPVTQENLEKLRSRGITIVGPGEGRLASGLTGMGRLIENDEILGAIFQALGRNGDLAGKRIIISAGGTREPIDIARYISNRSTGKMGYAIAEAARDRGATVILVTGPAALNPPTGVEVIQVETASQMQDTLHKAVSNADAIIMAAAVADYRAASVPEDKIKRQSAKLTLELIKTDDIIGGITGDIVKIGFAAESDDLEARANDKLMRKQLDLIVANDITAPDSGFAVDTNRVIFIDRQGKIERLPLMMKSEVAHKILDKVAELFSKV